VTRPTRDSATKLRLLEMADQLGDVSAACRALGFSRDSYYRFKRMVAAGGPDALDVRKHRDNGGRDGAQAITHAVLDLARTNPSYGRHMVSKILFRQGLDISPSGVRLVWLQGSIVTPQQRLAWAKSAKGYDSDDVARRPLAAPLREEVTEEQRSACPMCD